MACDLVADRQVVGRLADVVDHRQARDRPLGHRIARLDAHDRSVLGHEEASGIGQPHHGRLGLDEGHLGLPEQADVHLGALHAGELGQGLRRRQMRPPSSALRPTQGLQ